MSWHKRYKAMKKDLEWTNKTIAKFMGNTPNSVKTVTRPSKELPRGYKLAVVVYETLTKVINELKQ